MFFKTHPKTIEELDSRCHSQISMGDFIKAANTAFDFKNSTAKSSNYDDEEKTLRIAAAYYWLAKSSDKQMTGGDEKKIYELLVSFFASHALATYLLQKILKESILSEINKNHRMYNKYVELNDMYENIYKRYDQDLVGKADYEANKKVSLG